MSSTPSRATRWVLAPSDDSSVRVRRPVSRLRADHRPPRRRQRGLALVLALTAVAILTVVLSDMHESTAAAYSLATTQRDRLKAEYLARSGLNLTRLLIANRQPITEVVSPIYALLSGGRSPGNLSVWTFANEVLQPFCAYEQAEAVGLGAGIDLRGAEGLDDTGGTCDILAFSENSRINVNKPLRSDNAARNVAMQFYGLIGGYQQSSPYDPLFEQRDADGLITGRQDMVSALIDWWDDDFTRTDFDPGALTVTSSGAEDDPYARFDDPYEIKNAPFDSLEELRMVRGVGDDFWATFVESDPLDPRSRAITVYGSGRINPNEAAPQVLYAQTCAVIPQTTLCQNPEEAAKFVQLLLTVRSLAPVPWFLSADEFIAFLRGGEGRGNQQLNLYNVLRTLLGEGHPLLFTPVDAPDQEIGRLHEILVFDAQIIYVEVTGRVGQGCAAEDAGRCTRVKLQSVLNFHSGRGGWTPPPPNPGAMPRLGIFHHFRID
ncbi:MAG: general secretion pathway protein GspK [Sandaracinaceae bacterium]